MYVGPFLMVLTFYKNTLICVKLNLLQSNTLTRFVILNLPLFYAHNPQFLCSSHPSLLTFVKHQHSACSKISKNTPYLYTLYIHNVCWSNHPQKRHHCQALDHNLFPFIYFSIAKYYIQREK